MERAIFYISGFDPRGDKFYKRVFKNELSKFSKNNQLKAVFSQTNNSDYKIKSNNANCDLFLLSWIDIIQKIYQKSRLKTWYAAFVSFVVIISNKTALKNIIPYKYQSFFISLVFIDLIIYGCLLLIISVLLIKQLYIYAIIMLITASFIIFSYKRIIQKIIPDKIRIWVQGFISLVYFSNKYQSDFIENAQAQASKIMEIIDANNHDEYIIISHSAGGYPLIFILSVLPIEYFKKIKIITLGHCIPGYINLKHLQNYRDRLIPKLQQAKTKWLDIYSPADPVSSMLNTEKAFANLGITSQNSKFFNMYDQDTYTKLKQNPLIIHFQYIMSGDISNNTLNFYKILTSTKPITNYDI